MKYIKILFFALIVNMFFITSVKAENVYDYVEYGDVVIGNTVFDGWVSANRAAKAGILYYQNNSHNVSLEINTYMYFGNGRWKIYDDNTNKYRVLTGDELTNFEENINIYYINNNPIVHTYKNLNVEGSDIDYLFSLNKNYSIIENESDVTFDFEKEEILCPYDKVFNFEVIYYERSGEGTNPPVGESFDYIGICSTNEFEIVDKYKYESEPLELLDFELVIDDHLLNQDKVTIDEEDKKNNNIFLTINEELENYEVDLSTEIYDRRATDYFLVYDLKFNNTDFITIMDSAFDHTELIVDYLDNNIIRLYLPTKTYMYSNLNLLFYDDISESYETFYIHIDGLDIPQIDVNLNYIETVYDESNINQEIVRNISLESHENEWSDGQGNSGTNINYASKITTIGELQNVDLNGFNSKWIGFDIYFDYNIDIDYMNVHQGEEEIFKFEYFEDFLRVYMDASNIEDYVNINFYYDNYDSNEKAGRGSTNLTLYFNKFDEDNYIEFSTDTFEFVDIDEEGLPTIMNDDNVYSYYYDYEREALFYKEANYGFTTYIYNGETIKCINYNPEDKYEEYIKINDVVAIVNEDQDDLETSTRNYFVTDEQFLQLENYDNTDINSVKYFFNRSKTIEEDRLIKKLLSEGVVVADLSFMLYDKLDIIQMTPNKLGDNQSKINGDIIYSSYESSDEYAITDFYEINTIGELTSYELDGITDKWLGVDIKLNNLLANAKTIEIVQPENSTKNFIYNINDEVINLYVPYSEDQIILNIVYTLDNDYYTEEENTYFKTIVIFTHNYNENNYVEYTDTIEKYRTEIDEGMVRQLPNISSYKKIYLDDESDKLYYTEEIEEYIVKGEYSFKSLTIKNGNISTEYVIGVFYNDEGSIHIKRDGLDNLIENNDDFYKNGTLVYFFNGDKNNDGYNDTEDLEVLKNKGYTLIGKSYEYYGTFYEEEFEY